MKKSLTILSVALLSAFFVSAPASASTWDWTSIFGGNSNSQSGSQTTNTIGNLLEGIFSHTDISVEEMAGTWLVDGSAVAFKSEDFLSQAGGTAAAAAIQTELDPYYQKYGLTGATITIDKEGNCQIKLKRGTLKGVITRVDKGEFLFKITVLGQTLSSIPLYVRKTSTTMDMMFDVAKLKQILQMVAKFSGNSLAQTVVSILDKYDGVYVGFGMHAEGTTSTSNDNTNSTGSDGTTGSGQQSGLGSLLQILTGGKK